MTMPRLVKKVLLSTLAVGWFLLSLPFLVWILFFATIVIGDITGWYRLEKYMNSAG